MSSPTERSAAGGGAAALPESPADPPPTVPASPERAPGRSGRADGGTPDRSAPDRGGADRAPADEAAGADDGADHGDADHGAGDHGSFVGPVFLRAGRAGLAPEAVTVAGQPGDDGPASPLPPAAPDVAGLPPWADELPSPEPDSLPPWEAGPWPGYELPGGDPGRPPVAAPRAGGASRSGAGLAASRPAGSGYPADDRRDRGPALGHPASGGPSGVRPADPFAGHFADLGPFPGPTDEPEPAASAALGSAPVADTALDAFLAGDTALDALLAGDTALDAFPAVGASLSPGGPAIGARRPAAGEPAAANPLGTAALAAGILGIAVVPGLILGILGLRRATITGTGRLPSWLGIALSVLWAAGIIVLAWPGPGSAADPGCVQYRATGSVAVARVTSALRPGVPAAQLRASLGPASDAVNDAAASAQNIGVRNTLAALSSDLQAEQAGAAAGRAAPAALGATTARDAAAAGHLCGTSS
jgi:hypothetical protein